MMRPPISIVLMLMLLTVLASVHISLGETVAVEATDWLYVRYGPGLGYPRIGWIVKGTRYPVLRRNPDQTWLEIAYPVFAGGRGWVYRAGVTVYGDLSSIRTTTETTQGYPALTATPPQVVTSVPRWTAIAPPERRLGKLADSVYQLLLRRGFEPGTQKVASAFLMDVQTGEHYSIYPSIAYSGASLIKLPILVAFYRRIASVPSFTQAEQLALMIICSENISANQLLTFLGDGDAVKGAEYVTETMQRLGLRDTYLSGALTVEPNAASSPAVPRRTTADQVITRPDPYNQTTPADLGWLLAGVYRCSIDGTGALAVTFPTEFTAQKCRGILRVLLANDIPALLRAGVPTNIRVAHKHGWIDEVHGDAGLIFTPGGDYVLVIILRNREWLDYADSFPTIAEASRLVYNTFNPADKLTEVQTERVPACNLATIDPQLFYDLRSGTIPAIRE
jgi:beta-lactamase class A